MFGVRNGADMWLRELLDLMGFSQHFLLPILTVGILLAWHHTTRQPWRLSGGVLCGMAVECVPLAFLLHLILQLQGGLLQNIAGSGCQCTGQMAVELSIAGTCRGLIQFLGAGIYEELLFRLILFSATAWALRRLGMASRASVVTAVLATSLLFSAAHYIGPYGDTLGLFSFLFRFLARHRRRHPRRVRHPGGVVAVLVSVAESRDSCATVCRRRLRRRPNLERLHGRRQSRLLQCRIPGHPQIPGTQRQCLSIPIIVSISENHFVLRTRKRSWCFTPWEIIMEVR
jgi:membrane protease YdiL (CAAX protease family)